MGLQILLNIVNGVGKLSIVLKHSSTPVPSIKNDSSLVIIEKGFSDCIFEINNTSCR